MRLSALISFWLPVFHKFQGPANRQDADTIRKLAGEANNINQLAHRANAGGFALVAVELVKLKNRIVEIINQLSDDWKNKKGKRI